jgi:prepilin-type processing-associated H-X9-DG protein
LYHGPILEDKPANGKWFIRAEWRAGSYALPGAINVSFYDGHVEQVKLERLWQLSWHRDYVPPPKRPGLK